MIGHPLVIMVYTMLWPPPARSAAYSTTILGLAYHGDPQHAFGYWCYTRGNLAHQHRHDAYNKINAGTYHMAIAADHHCRSSTSGWSTNGQ